MCLFPSMACYLNENGDAGKNAGEVTERRFFASARPAAMAIKMASWGMDVERMGKKNYNSTHTKL